MLLVAYIVVDYLWGMNRFHMTDLQRQGNVVMIFTVCAALVALIAIVMSYMQVALSYMQMAQAEEIDARNAYTLNLAIGEIMNALQKRTEPAAPVVFNVTLFGAKK